MVTLESTDAEILAEMERVRVFYKLKTTLRYGTTRPDEFSESVAEHLFAMQVIAQYFLPFEDPQGKLDRIRMNELMLFHELGEIETGDIIFHRKTDEHYKEERRAAERVSKIIPDSLQTLALERLDEFEEKKTPESRFVVAVDKIEPVFEMFPEHLITVYFREQQMTREIAVRKKYDAARDFPYMRRFLQAWENRAVSLDIFPE